MAEYDPAPVISQPSPRRVLVVSYDHIGRQMAGPAIRAYELSRVLARENEVVLACRRPPEREGDGFRVQWYGEREGALQELVEWAEIVLAFGFLLLECPDIVKLGKVVIADVYDPFTLEVLVQRSHDAFDVQLREYQGALGAMNEQLLAGDLFLVASERQRDLVFGMLAALGRINPYTYRDDPTFQRLLAVVPFGLPSEAPRRPTQPVLRGVRPGFDGDDLILLWAGGIYDWFDPLSLIKGVAALSSDKVKLFFMGMAHPNPDVPEMTMSARAVALAEELGVKDRLVFFNQGWVPYDERTGYLLESDIGVSTHYWHMETAYAFRTRMLDYIWGGLPVLCTEGDTLADLVAHRGLGEVVPPEDPDAIARAIVRLSDPDRRQRCSANLADLAQTLRWEKVAEPILRFCRDPHHASDRAAGFQGRQLELLQLRDELSELRRDNDGLRQDRAGLLREIDELTAFRDRVVASLPYRIARRVRRITQARAG